MLIPEDKELLRLASLEVLVSCHPVPRPLHAIRRNVNREVSFHFTDEELLAALEFLRALDLVSYEIEHLGTTRWWVASPAGVLKVERAAIAAPPSHD